MQKNEVKSKIPKVALDREPQSEPPVSRLGLGAVVLCCITQPTSETACQSLKGIMGGKKVGKAGKEYVI